MQITAAKTISAIAIAGVAVLGAQYAGAATPSHSAKAGSHSKSADPNIAPIRNLSHVYGVSTSGGTGQESYTIPNPPNGVYSASFSASFYPQGTPAAPKTFSCYLLKDGLMRSQSTASSTYDSGFYVGVNGIGTVKVGTDSSLTVGCGLADGGAWTWGTRPLSVTLMRTDGLVVHSLAKSAHKALVPVAGTR